MSEIISSLGITVNDAIAALDKLDAKFTSAFESMAEKVREFNSILSSTSTAIKDSASSASALNKIGTAATSNTSAIDGMSSAQTGAANNIIKSSASAASALNKIGTAAQSNINSLLGMGKAQSAMGGGLGLGVSGKATTPTGPAAMGAPIMSGGIKIGNLAQDIDKAEKATGKFIVTWNTLGRVIMTQMIVRALSNIRDMIGEATESALKFQVAIAEIQTIAPKIDKNFRTLGKEVADMSTKFNFPLPDTAEALYQTISDQFTTAAERADIMKASAELAKVGVMSLADAVQLLTGTLNAYGMASSEAETVAAKYFKTIELGRVRGNELVQVVGKLMPMAAALGVNLDSVNASMVALTIGGMKSSEASTALRGGFTALLKPSEAMKNELRSLGYETAQQIIAAEGLQGAFLKLAASTDGDANKLATLFRNVRGLNAEMRLTGPGAIKSSQAFDVMQSTTAETLQNVYKEFRTTDADKFTSAINEIKVYLATELGPELVKSLSKLLSFVGGVGTLKAAMNALVSAFPPVIAGIAAIGTGMAVLKIRAMLLTSTFSGNFAAYAGIVTGIVAAWSAGASALDTLVAERIQNVSNKAREASTKSAEELSTDMGILTSVREQAEAKQLADLEKFASQLRQSYNQQVDAAKKANTEIISAGKVAMESMISTRERMAGVYRATANTQIQEAKKASRASMEAEREYSDSVFNFASRNLSAWDRVMEYSRRARLESGQGSEELSKSKSPEQAVDARDKIARALTAAQTAMSSAGRDTYLQEEAQHGILSIIQQKSVAERAYASNAKASGQAATQAATAEQSRVDRMKTLMPIILKEMDMFKKGEPKSKEDRDKLVAQTKKDVAEFQNVWLTGGKASTAELLNWTELKEKLSATMEGGISQIDIQGFFATPEAIEKLTKQIEVGVRPMISFREAATGLNPALKEKTKGMTGVEATNYLTGVAPKEAMAAKKEYITNSQEIVAAQTAIKTSASELRTVLEDNNKFLASTSLGDRLERGATNFQRNTSDMLNGAMVGGEGVKSLQKILNQYAQVSQYPGMGTMTNYEQLLKQVEAAKAAGGLSNGDISLLDVGLEKIKAMATAWHAVHIKDSIQDQLKTKAIDAEQNIKDIDAARKAQPNIGGATSKAKELNQPLMDANGEVSTLNSKSLSGLITQLQDATMAATQLSFALASTSSESMMEAAHGGVAYLASGGRGTDTINAMLSPGEMVMNSAASNKFATQLSAMNAGIQPTYNQSSNVTNVGDIHVSVNGGKTGQQTVREIAAGLRREVRRGTIF